ncbi:MAG: hypothetical protein V4655_06190 [Bdellovibrionota bacterium]
MKFILSFVTIALLAACGSEAPQYINKRGTTDVAKQQAALVKSVQELPSCDRGRLNTIVFVGEISRFKVCKNENWIDVDASQENELKNTVVEIRQIKAVDVDLCSEESTESCFLDGGEYVRYADGRVKYSARIARKTSTPVANTYHSMDAMNASKANIEHDASWPSSEALLIPSIQRGSVNSGVWLRYDADDRSFILFFDTNHDRTFSPGDEILAQPQLVEF